MITTDGVALRSGAGNKYNTNRPKGKLDSTQVEMMMECETRNG